MNKIKTGDQVIVVAGKDKGKQGSVTKSFRMVDVMYLGFKW